MALSSVEGRRALSLAKASQNALWVMKLSFLNYSERKKLKNEIEKKNINSDSAMLKTFVI